MSAHTKRAKCHVSKRARAQVSFHRNNDPTKNNMIFNAQFSGKIAQIKRLRFFISLTKTSLLMKRLRLLFFCSLQSSNARYVFQEICLAENSDVVRKTKKSMRRNEKQSRQFVNENLIKLSRCGHRNVNELLRWKSLLSEW